MSVIRNGDLISATFPGLTNQEFGAIRTQFQNKDMNWYISSRAIQRDGDRVVVNTAAAGRDAHGFARQVEGFLTGFLLGRKIQ